MLQKLYVVRQIWQETRGRRCRQRWTEVRSRNTLLTMLSTLAIIYESLTIIWGILKKLTT